jgi:putative transcriptional regulator
MSVIRNNLKNIRYEHKMNQGEFAEFLGIAQSQYSRYERQKEQPSLETALKISEKIKRSVNDICYLVPE